MFNSPGKMTLLFIPVLCKPALAGLILVVALMDELPKILLCSYLENLLVGKNVPSNIMGLKKQMTNSTGFVLCFASSIARINRFFHGTFSESEAPNSSSSCADRGRGQDLAIFFGLLAGFPETKQALLDSLHFLLGRRRAEGLHRSKRLRKRHKNTSKHSLRNGSCSAL